MILKDVGRQDFGRMVTLAKSTLGSDWTEPFLEWKYFQNPAGPVCGGCAEIGGVKVGYYSGLPVTMSAQGRTVCCAQAVDGMVAREARRGGVFVATARYVHEILKQRRVELCYAFPNPVSKAAFLNRLDWTYVGDVPRFVRVLDARSAVDSGGSRGLKGAALMLAIAFVQRLCSPTDSYRERNLVVREIDRFDKSFDDLWQEAGAGLGLSTRRDSEYLNWRYVHNPLVEYVRFVAEADGRLCGYLVLSLRDIGKGVASVAEVLVLGGEMKVGRALMTAAEQTGRKRGAAQLHCWMLPHQQFYVSLLRSSGYVFTTSPHVPRLFRYTTPLLVSFPSAVAGWATIESLAGWFVTMGDHDYF